MGKVIRPTLWGWGDHYDRVAEWICAWALQARRRWFDSSPGLNLRLPRKRGPFFFTPITMPESTRWFKHFNVSFWHKNAPSWRMAGAPQKEDTITIRLAVSKNVYAYLRILKRKTALGASEGDVARRSFIANEGPKMASC